VLCHEASSHEAVSSSQARDEGHAWVSSEWEPTYNREHHGSAAWHTWGRQTFAALAAMGLYPIHFQDAVRGPTPGLPHERQPGGAPGVHRWSALSHTPLGWGKPHAFGKASSPAGTELRGDSFRRPRSWMADCAQERADAAPDAF